MESYRRFLPYFQGEVVNNDQGIVFIYLNDKALQANPGGVKWLDGRDDNPMINTHPACSLKEGDNVFASLVNVVYDCNELGVLTIEQLARHNRKIIDVDGNIRTDRRFSSNITALNKATRELDIEEAILITYDIDGKLVFQRYKNSVKEYYQKPRKYLSTAILTVASEICANCPFILKCPPGDYGRYLSQEAFGKDWPDV